MLGVYPKFINYNKQFVIFKDIEIMNFFLILDGNGYIFLFSTPGYSCIRQREMVTIGRVGVFLYWL